MNNALTKTLTSGLMHGLKVGLPEDSNPQEVTKLAKDAVCLGVNTKCIEMWYKTQSVLPYLFPMSLLTKEIEVGGKKITPLVELAKICHPNWPWEILRQTNVHSTFMWVDFDFESCPEYSFGIESNVEDINFFTLREGDPRDTRFQIKAHEWLIEHHFNVFNLSPE